MLVQADQKFFERNYNEFVHLQYLSEIMKLIPEVHTPDNGERIDDVTITTDKNGENPVTIKYEKDGVEKELHLKPEITDRVNELIRDNIHVLQGANDKEWERINFVKNPEHNYFEVECKLKDGNTVNTVIPNMTADDLKQINQIKAYDKKIVIKYLEEDTAGVLQEREKVYNFELYATKEEMNTAINNVKSELVPQIEANKNRLKQKNTTGDTFDIEPTGHVNFEVDYGIKAIEIKRDDTDETFSERVDFDTFTTKEELNTELQDIRDTLANIGEIHNLSDKACSYSCDNHPGKQGYCTLFTIGETGKVLVNFAISFDTCLNNSLVAGEQWTVECNPIDLTNDQAYTGNYNDEQTIVEILYDDGTMHYVDATTNMRSTSFIVPADAERGHIKKAWIRDQILFTPKE